MQDIYVFMKGVNVNHDGETFYFKATTDPVEAEKTRKELEELNKISGVNDDETGIEYGNDWGVFKDCYTDTQFVYAVWLNELSRKYAGNELVGLFTSLHDALDRFYVEWRYQTERWNFKDKIPTVNLGRNSFYQYRNNENDCDQTQGICRIEVNKSWIKAY